MAEPSPIRGSLRTKFSGTRTDLVGKGQEHPPTLAISNTDTDTDTAIQAVLRLATDHTGHDLLLLADYDQWEDYFDGQDWADTIRNDTHAPWAFGDITREQDLAGWPEHTRLPRYRGFDPVDPPHSVELPPAHTRVCCTSSMSAIEPPAAPRQSKFLAR